MAYYGKIKEFSQKLNFFKIFLPKLLHINFS